MTARLPRPNQVDDFRRHLEIGETCQRLATEGHKLLAAGDVKGARERLARADELVEERELIAERWKPKAMGSVENPEHSAPVKARKRRVRR